MDVDNLSPVSKALLLQALSGGQLVNVLYRAGARVEGGIDRDRRCFALGERGWLSFLGWERGEDVTTRWALTAQAQELLGGNDRQAA
jgi:hypothetical protein